MLAGPIIEFISSLPVLVSAGHDGFFPYQFRPLDEIYITASRWSSDPKEHDIEIWLPHNNILKISNFTGISDTICVHRSGFLWHDQTREIHCQVTDRWLSVYGFTSEDPRNFEPDRPPIFAVLPGSPMQDKILDLLLSKSWREVKDFHTRHRKWMQNNHRLDSLHVLAVRYERDKTLIAKLKKERGSSCQICGFTFTKKDGTDYCEIHHLESLSEGGFDVASNMLVLCANCHRRFHYGNIQVLSHTATELVVVIDGINHSCAVGS